MSKEAAVLAEDYLVELHQLSEERDALRSKLDLAVKALERFSDIGAWMFNGECDANSSNFCGQDIARTALAAIKEGE